MSLRCSVFAITSVRMWGAQIQVGDVVRGPYAESASSPVHERDIAEVAARVLLADGRRFGDLLGTRVRVSGPQSLTQAEQVAIIGEAIGRPLRYQEIPPEAARQAMARRNPPPGFVDAQLAFQAAGVGEPAFVSPGVEKITGRPAIPFADWAAEHAADFALV